MSNQTQQINNHHKLTIHTVIDINFEHNTLKNVCTIPRKRIMIQIIKIH